MKIISYAQSPISENCAHPPQGGIVCTKCSWMIIIHASIHLLGRGFQQKKGATKRLEYSQHYYKALQYKYNIEEMTNSRVHVGSLVAVKFFLCVTVLIWQLEV